LGNLEEGLSPMDFERWTKGTVGMWHLSLKRLYGEGIGVGGSSFTGVMKDMLRKAPDTGISLHRGPLMT